MPVRDSQTERSPAIEKELKCEKCAHHLKGLHPEGVCPACGWPNADSLAHHDMVNRSPFRRVSIKKMNLLFGAHLFLSGCFMAGWILPYHINGRAWHDYGGAWDPPPYYFDDGTVGRANYGARYTRPFVWPIIGPLMRGLAFVSLLLVCPGLPVVVCVAAAAVLLTVVNRDRLGSTRFRWMLTFALLALLPHLYLAINGYRVADWFLE